MNFLLIASNEISVQESLRMLLKEDFSIFQARSGSEAINMVAHHPIDVVLLDTNLSNYKGLSLVDRLQEISKGLSFVIITTSKGPDILSLNENMYYEIISKPFEKGEVRWVIKKAFEHKKLLEEIQSLKNHLELGKTGGQPSKSYSEEPLYTNGHYPFRPSEREIFTIHLALKEFFKALTHVTDLDRLLDSIIHGLVEVFQVNKASIFLFDSANALYQVRASLGIEESRLKDFVLNVGKGLPAWFLRHNQILRKEDLENRGFSDESVIVNEQLKALDAKISAPLLTKGKLVGIISLGNKVTGRLFSEGDIELLSMITNYTAIAIENSLLYRELSLQKRYSENILNNIASGVIAIDTHGRITTYNPNAEKIMGVPHDEVIGKNIQKLGSVFADILLRTVEENKTISRYEVSHPLTKVPLGISTTMLRDENNQRNGAIMVFTDLKESKELEAKTRALERLRFWSTLANRMAQEIKNPLVAVKTFAQLLPDKYNDDEFRKSFFKVVTGEIDRLNTITESLLAFAQPREFKFEEADINELIDFVLRFKADPMRVQNTKIVKIFSPDPINAKVDRNHLAKAIDLLLDNSLEAMPKGGRLRIKTQKKRLDILDGEALDLPIKTREWIVIEIKDTGKGIPEEQLIDIFSPFFTTKVRGMGFGLPIAQRIIQDHQGKIEVQSEEGKGSTFRIILPLNIED